MSDNRRSRESVSHVNLTFTFRHSSLRRVNMSQNSDYKEIRQMFCASYSDTGRNAEERYDDGCDV